MTFDENTVSITVTEPRSVPATSVFFGGIALVPMVVGAALGFVADGWAPLFVDLTLLWGATIVIFLAGVRRGVSFRTMNGPTTSQLLVMLWLFGLGSGSLLVTALSVGTGAVPPAAIASALLAVGFASLVILDPIAADRGEAPLFFKRLRPVQMPVAALAYGALTIAAL
ncbi:DUF3429 domain-containing protein [Acuticoccus sp.]|uniref:DUF3429 domain-containing protein n=1 Tax=Acuticoccus sp. TaxID=1904378 RepID=UPI003B52AC59